MAGVGVRALLITVAIATSIALVAVAAPPRLVIADVTVVDTTGGPLQPHRDVIVDGDRIVAVQPTGGGAHIAEAQIVDGRGGFLIPGLWDMHAHAFDANGLLQELGLFVDAGFSPLEALQTATIVPARFLHREQQFGSIKPGRAADLVLLDDDPTRNVRNTTKIRAVILRGELLDRAALDSMLAGIKASVNSSK
jgi:imidazolonepropionase-like amidohydrolase